MRLWIKRHAAGNETCEAAGTEYVQKVAHILVRKSQDEWVEVRGTALRIPGRGRYRIIVTSDLGMFSGETAGRLEARVNGLEARDVVWVIAPQESATRGYVSFEASLEVDDHE